jgi:hypothetical protein
MPFAPASWGTSSDPWTTVVKTVDESVASSSAVQDDDELFFTGVAGALYEVELDIIYASPAGAGTPDLKVQFTDGGAITGQLTQLGPSTGDGGQIFGSVNSSSASFGTGAAKRMLTLRGWQLGTGAAVKLKWAQNTADANPTIVYAGSLLRYRRIA